MSPSHFSSREVQASLSCSTTAATQITTSQQEYGLALSLWLRCHTRDCGGRAPDRRVGHVKGILVISATRQSLNRVLECSGCRVSVSANFNVIDAMLECESTVFICCICHVPRTRKQSAVTASPYNQYLKAGDARKGYHEPTMSTKSSSMSQGSQNYEGQGQEGTQVFSKSSCNRA